MALPSPIIDLDSARELLRQAVPMWEELLEHLESSGGRLRFRPEVTTMISDLRIDHYPLLYENAAGIGNFLARALMGPEALAAFGKELESASPAGRGRIIADGIVQLDALGDPFDRTESEKEEAQKVFATLDQKTQQETSMALRRLMMVFFVLFYEQLSIAVLGEKLTSLVAQAKNGNAEAFGKAIQIDGRILTVIPYFKDRYARAITEDHENFRIMVSRKLSLPPYKGRIEQKALWMTFAYLEGVGLLYALPREKLLDLCNKVGAGKSGEPIDDVNNLNKCLARYREFQERGKLSTP